MDKRILLLDDPAPLSRSHSATDGAGGMRCRATLSLRWTVGWIFYSWFVHGADRSRGEVPGFVWYLDSSHRCLPWFLVGFALLQTAVSGWLE